MLNVNVGDRVVYVPDQNKGENLHFDAVVLARGKRESFFKIDVIGKKPRLVHRKRLLVGQIDAFPAKENGL